MHKPDPFDIEALLAFHRQTFGDLRMEDGDDEGDDAGDGGTDADDKPKDTAPPAKRSLEDLLATLDEDARKAILGEVRTARNEAKNLRAENKRLSPLAQAAKDAADAAKPEIDRLRDTATERDAAAKAADMRAWRLEVALDKGLTKGQAARLVGESLEDLMADADAYLAENGQGKRTPPGTRPKANVKPGGGTGEEQEPFDPKKAADEIRSGRR